MVINTQLMSDLPVPPGEYLLEVVEELGISQADLARRMGRPAQAINEIIKGEKAITSGTALQLEQVIGVPAHIWTGLESKFQLVKARLQADIQEAEEAKCLSGWLKGLPYTQLVKFAGLPDTRMAVEKVRALRHFLGLASLHNLEGVGALRPAFRQSQKVAISQLALSVWLRRAELMAQAQDIATYSKEKLAECLPAIRAMTTQLPEVFIPRLRDQLAFCGVAFIIQRSLPKTGVHGATFWMTPRKAVLVLTIRGAWTDIFWFSLLHELGHLLLHKKNQTFLENDSGDPDLQKLEAEADAFAAGQLILPGDFDTFLLDTGGRFSKVAVLDFADRIGVEPGIVVGRLHHQKLVPPQMLNGLRSTSTWADESA